MTFDLAFYLTDLWLILAGILVTLLVSGEIGWRVGLRSRKQGEASRTLIGGVAAAMVGFLGLLLAFTMSMAVNLYEVRRTVIIDEANAIGTLSLRAGLLGEPLAAEMQGVLRDYVQTRLDMGRMGTDLDKLRAARARSAQLLKVIWSIVERAAVPETSPAVVAVLVTAANEVIDLDEVRMAALESYVPSMIIVLLVGVAAVAVAFLCWSFGAAKQRSRVSMVTLAFLVTVVLGVIMDINRPHRGVFRVSDRSLVRLQQTLAAPPAP